MCSEDIEKLKKEEKHTFSSLVQIMQILRSENGCPWDREQTHDSIRSNLIEETYEAVEAIDNHDPVLLREELGDVLLQVVFHARMAEEESCFTIDDVIDELCAKLIHRHPHVFGDVQANTSEEVLSNWESIKTEEKKRAGLGGSLAAIPPALPALMRAQKMIKKAAKENAIPSADTAFRVCAKASACCDDPSQEELTERVEHMLLGAALIAQVNGLDAEKILMCACRRITDALTRAEAAPDWQSGENRQQREKFAESVFFGE